MTRITVQVEIEATTDETWAEVANFGGVMHASPLVLSSHSTSSANGGVGATRHCDLVGGAKAEERIVDWRDGEFCRIEVYKRHKMPMVTSMFGEMAVEPRPGGKSALAMTFDYRVGLGPIGWLMNTLMMRRMFTKSAMSAVAGFKRRIETGSAIEAGADLDLSPVSIGMVRPAHA